MFTINEHKLLFPNTRDQLYLGILHTVQKRIKAVFYNLNTTHIRACTNSIYMYTLYAHLRTYTLYIINVLKQLQIINDTMTASETTF